MSIYLIDKSGIYLMGQIAKEINTSQEIYMIKIGQSKNLRKRISQYKTVNPYCKCIDTIISDNYNSLEKQYHKKIKSINGTQIDNTEWYIVSKTLFEKCLKYGFDIIDFYSIKQNNY